MLLVILKGIFIISKMELTVQDCMKMIETEVKVYAIFPIKDFELRLDEFVEKFGIYYPTI